MELIRYIFEFIGGFAFGCGLAYVCIKIYTRRK